MLTLSSRLNSRVQINGCPQHNLRSLELFESRAIGGCPEVVPVTKQPSA